MTAIKPHAIDEASAIGTLRAAIGHPSITGAEASFAAYLAELLSAVGMQEIIVDYVHGPVAKYLALLGNMFFCSVVGLAAIYAVLKMSSGV